MFLFDIFGSALPILTGGVAIAALGTAFVLSLFGLRAYFLLALVLGVATGAGATWSHGFLAGKQGCEARVEKAVAREQKRQADANEEARALGHESAIELVRGMGDLNVTLEKNANEAKSDPDAARGCFPASSVRRIKRVR